MRPFDSLFGRLFWLLFGVISAAVVASDYFAYRSGVIEAGELFDAKLAHSARVLRGLADGAFHQGDGSGTPVIIDVWAGVAGGEGLELATTSGHAYETKLAFQVFSAEGALLLASDNAPRTPLAAFAPGYADPLVDGQRWRSFVLRSESGRWYLASERWDVRADIAGDIARGLLLPLAIELPLVAVLVWLAIRLASRRLRAVTGELERRAADRLQPIRESDAPVEIRRLAQAVNRLLAELDAALQRERRFTADAAHELRTPIAALRVHLENLRAAPSADAREQSTLALQRGLARLERLVEQLLTLSRLEPGAVLPSLQAVDLLAVSQQVASELLDAGVGEGIELELDGERPVRVTGDPLSLGILLRNLLDNALRYTPAPGRVRLTVSVIDGRGCVVCEDSGPGIPPSERERALARFHRGLGSGVEGSGLGLSIAARVAALHGGELELEDATLGGLGVRLCLPLAEPGTRT